MSIGTRIIQIRNQKGINQRQLGERSGIASSYLSRIENRRLEPRPKTLRKIADALGVTVSEIFQERGAGPGIPQCVITSSGRCMMELLSSGRRRRRRSDAEAYSPRQVQLLRMASYLIQTGNTRLLEALEVLFESLLSTAGSRGEAKHTVNPLMKLEAPTKTA